MAAVYTDLTVNMNVQSSKTPVIQGITPLDPFSKIIRTQFSSGTGAGNADKFWYAERTIAPSANDDLDISGTLVDNFNQTFTIARVKALIVVAGPSDPTATRNANNLLMGAAGANPWVGLVNSTGVLTFKPDSGAVFWAFQTDGTGWPVVAGTGDILRFTNGGAGTSVVYQIGIVGVSV